MAKYLDIFDVENNIEFNKPVKAHFGYKTGGNAYGYIEVSNTNQLKRAILYLETKNLPYKILGNGTNILLSDKGYDGVLISLKKMNSIMRDGETKVKVCAGANVNSLIDFCYNLGLSGLEELYMIPATIGGAISMNASCFSTSISDCIEEVVVLRSKRLHKYSKKDCEFGYRTSRFLHTNEVIVSATFDFRFLEKDIIFAKKQSVKEKRNSTQPKGRSCGSVFKNGEGYFSAKLIDECGLKGTRIGGAYLSKKHANFIIADKDCTSNDVYNLIGYVKEKVKEKFNVSLIEEIEYLGDF